MVNMVNIEQVEKILSNPIPMVEWNGQYEEVFREGEKVIEMSPPQSFPGLSNLVVVRIRNLESDRSESAKFKAEGFSLRDFIVRLSGYGFKEMICTSGKIYYPGGWNSARNSDFWYPGCGWWIPEGSWSVPTSSF